MSEVLALQSMFEGLYVRGLRPEGAFREKLKAAGYDLERQHTSYPLGVWTRCLDISWQEVYPSLSREKAWEALGRRFIEGYLQTLVGKMIGATLPFLNPKTFIGRTPRFITTGLQGADVTLEWTGEKTATLTLRGVHEYSSSLMMGVMAVCFERMRGASVTMERRVLGPVDTAVLITLA